ncbi:MAG: endonuclease V [Thermoprotei archaeon]|nr:MAG: endonuclease V [Thermoprotei archaeon]
MELQQYLSRRVLEELDSFPQLNLDKLQYIVGVDAAYHKDLMCGVAVLLDYRTGFVLKEAVVYRKPAIPYVPGLLAFREAPAYIAAIKKLGAKPDVVFVDGHGLSHPRAFGIATHVGLVLNTPSVGIAKKKLYGEEKIEDGERVVWAHGRVVAKVIEHRGKKLYVSIGYKIRLEDAVKLTKKLTVDKYKLPLPIALADQLSKKFVRRLK